MVYRVYVEKKESVNHEVRKLYYELSSFLKIETLKKIRILKRYDVENVSREVFQRSIKTVFSEPPVDNVVEETGDENIRELLSLDDEDFIFAVEYLPGQYDQRADSASQCIQIISQGVRPLVKTATVYVMNGVKEQREIEKIKKYVINPIESREVDLDIPESLETTYPEPDDVSFIHDFIDMGDIELESLLKEKGFAMDMSDLIFCRDYFRSENRNPTITELKIIDTYWSDHCRHTTFNTVIDSVEFEDELIRTAYEEYLAFREELGIDKPVTLMDIATVSSKYLKKEGKLIGVDESDEINACTVKIKVDIDGKKEDYLLLFKNETHNHPTEIEPFGGAATCIGGAIRDIIAGRGYAYAAMRITGAADPTRGIDETMKGKLPQRKIVTSAASGYSSYGNQIGLATGLVDEIYHEGYMAKHMEIGAVIGAVPLENVLREKPEAGDIVVLLGGRTGRDGIGGATGSSKSHTVDSLEDCGAEVQKGNAPEERKLQRLFRNREATELIKKCNDFGAGGVAVAVGELSDGLIIDLDKVPKKYEGLDATEIAISESQERMAVVIDPENRERFFELASSENIESTVLAEITDNKRIIMLWRGKKVVDISREFLDTNGSDKHIDITVSKPENYAKKEFTSFKEGMIKLVNDLNICSKRGLVENFDSTIGASSVFMPYGGKYQLTPTQVMVHNIPVNSGITSTASVMSYAYNPFITEKSPYHGGYLSVVEAVSKLIASGVSPEGRIYLSLQEYFERFGKNARKWGKGLSAILGSLKAQTDLGVAAIGGKDSMSGSFEDLHVPPTIVTFAVSTSEAESLISPELKKEGSRLIAIIPEYSDEGIPKKESLHNVYRAVHSLIKSGKAISSYSISSGGIAETLFKMSIGNKIGVNIDSDISLRELFKYNYGGFVLEITGEEELSSEEYIIQEIGKTTINPVMKYMGTEIDIDDLISSYESRLESVYPTKTEREGIVRKINGEKTEFKPSNICVSKPKVLIPVFPGTNCEYDSSKAFECAGAEVDTFVIKNLKSEYLRESVEKFAEKIKESQIIFIAGGFSGGDEPDGSAKFISSFFRNPLIKERTHELLSGRDGLILGICNGFQALIKLGLLPFGKITDMHDNSPTLTYNEIGRHQSRIVRVRVASKNSPWLANTNLGEVYSVPISHGEGRFLSDRAVLEELVRKGQIATQYVDFEGNPTLDVQFNPNSSTLAVEGLLSEDGRVFGKMGHSERIGKYLYKNVPGKYDMGLFKAGVEYFKK